MNERRQLGEVCTRTITFASKAFARNTVKAKLKAAPKDLSGLTESVCRVSLLAPTRGRPHLSRPSR